MEFEPPRPHITTAQRKAIAALKSARSRREAGLFVAEGWRCLSELLPYFPVRQVVALPQWLAQNGSVVPTDCPILTSTAREMEQMSSMQTPQGVIGVFEMPAPANDFTVNQDELVLALDRVQDPGNLGTIIRTADWFGVERIWASADTADVFNPKVIQSTMGALARVRVSYTDQLAEILRQSQCKVPVYGTFLDGEDIYTASKLTFGVLVMGNEGAGISDAVASAVNRRLKIPSFPPGRQSVESLNVAVATAICLAEFRRNGQNF